jgi:hypothetical protein
VWKLCRTFAPQNIWLNVRRRGNPRSISVEHSAKLPLYQWSADHGDFNTMHEILTRAEHDPELAVIITAINGFTLDDIPQLEEASHQARALVQHILEHYQNKNPERLE